jgi:hypothetical protein
LSSTILGLNGDTRSIQEKRLILSIARTSFLLLAVLPLAACESSTRLPSFGNPFGQSQRVAPQIAAAPAPQVQSAPLAPPVIQQDLPAPSNSFPQAAQPPVITPVSPPDAALEPNRNTITEPPKTEPPKVAARSAPEPESRAAPSRTSVIGNWSATEASGSACRLTLSSSPKLDLYNAGTTGCQNKDLQKITAWELRDDEVYLYEAGGAVTARLKAAGNCRFNGALAKTGAPVSLSK